MHASFRDRNPLKRSSQEVYSGNPLLDKPGKLKAMPLDYHGEQLPPALAIRRREDQTASVRIRSAQFSFDVERAREQLARRVQEKQAVELSVAREKSLLREAFIMRQRQRLTERGLL